MTSSIKAPGTLAEMQKNQGSARKDVVKTEHYFVYAGVRYHFVCWQPAQQLAAERRPLVLLHGFAQSTESWDEIASVLAPIQRVYALDFVGHGKSDQPVDTQPYALQTQAQVLVAFLNYLAGVSVAEAAAYQVELPAAIAKRSLSSHFTREVYSLHAQLPLAPVVAGYSMGGRIALTAAGWSPYSFAALLLEGVGLGPATQAQRTAAAQRDAENAARIRITGVEAFMEEWAQLPLFASQHSLPAPIQACLRAGRLSNSAEALACTFEGAGQHCMPDREVALDVLRSTPFPLSYIAGHQDSKYRKVAEELKQAALPIKVEVVEGAGHSVHLEAPLAFAHQLQNLVFLAEKS